MDNTRLLLLGNMFLRLQLLALLLLFVEQTNGAGCGPNQEMRCPGCEASCEKGYYQRCPSSCKPSAKKMFLQAELLPKGQQQLRERMPDLLRIPPVSREVSTCWRKIQLCNVSSHQ